MAGLPPDGRILIQQNDGLVTIFDSETQEEFLQFNPSNVDSTAIAQKFITDLTQLSDEAKCYAHFWSGYFYAYAHREN